MENEYIHIPVYIRKYFCLKCNNYIIFMKGTTNHSCPNCYRPSIQNVFIDEAKLYFNPSTANKNIRYIRQNDTPTVAIQYYSRKIISNMDNEK